MGETGKEEYRKATKKRWRRERENAKQARKRKKKT